MSGKWWQYLIPKYGNWGGPGWCGGRYCNDSSMTDWTVPPMDDMDALFKNHDMLYQAGIRHSIADGELVRGLHDVGVKGWYANGYRIGALIVFGIRSRIVE